MNRPALTRILGAVLLLCTAGVYARIWHFQFVNWDDANEVTENPLLHPPTVHHLWVFWSHPHLKLYGPLTYTIWWAMSRVPEMIDSPAAFHLLSLGLHLICTILVFSILSKCVKSLVAAFGGAALFALHPLQAESVAWVAETNNLLAAALSLAAIQIYLDADDAATNRRWGSYAAASGFYLLALFAKPTAVVAPLIAGILQIGVMYCPWRRAVASLAPWLAVAVVFGWIAHQVQNAPMTHLVDRPIVAVDAMAFYLGKLFWPVGLTVDYARTPLRVLSNYNWLIAASVVAALSLVLCLVRKTHPGITTGGLVMLAGLLPVLGLVPFAFQEFSTVADRFIYLAMLGPALALASVLARIRWETALAVSAVMGLILTRLTAAQLPMWENTAALIRHTLAIDPGSVVGNAIAGSTMDPLVTAAESARYLRAAIARDPTNGDYHYNLANALRDMDQYPEAIAEYQLAMGLWESPDGKALNNMGVGYAKMGRPDLAKAIFQRVLAMDPANAQATENLRLLADNVSTR